MSFGKTMFVLGAGASKEAGLPLGDELKNRIATLLNLRFDLNRLTAGDNLIVAALTHAEQVTKQYTLQECVHAARQVSSSMPLAISIDNYLDAHRGDGAVGLVGKLAIVRSILEAERKSQLWIDRSERVRATFYEKLGGSWYLRFFRLVTEGCSKDQLAQRFRSIGLVIFNYDRCFEHFMYYALQTYFQLKPAEAAEFVGFLEIHHPYGTAGKLAWQGGSVDFGMEVEGAGLFNLSRSIRTFTEGTDDQTSDVAGIRKLAADSTKWVFLGFAFHKLNLALLFGGDGRVLGPEKRKCVATAAGISESNAQSVSERLKKVVDPDSTVTLNRDLKCVGLIDEFWWDLSFQR